jgi:D-inositol-3-phosphate glycosyltransferase
MKKKSVAIVVPCIEKGGGVPSLALYLYKALSIYSNYQIDIISISTSRYDKNSTKIFSPKTWVKGIKVSEKKRNSINIINVGAYFTELEFMRYMPRKILTDILSQYNIVHVVSGTPAWGYICKNLRNNVFFHIATLSVLERQSLISSQPFIRRQYTIIMSKVTNLFDQISLKYAKDIFVLNDHMLKTINNFGYTNVTLSPPGLDTSLYANNDKKGNYIISVARYNDPRKNIRLLYDAFKIVKSSNNSDIRMIIASKYKIKDADIDYANKIGIDDYIDYNIGANDNDLRRLYFKSKFFVLSSNEEGFGIVIIEAMASGLPVISTRCGGPESIINNGFNGYLVSKNNPKEMAKYMTRLLFNNELLSCMSKNSTESTIDKFDYKNTIKKVIEKYEKNISQ